MDDMSVVPPLPTKFLFQQQPNSEIFQSYQSSKQFSAQFFQTQETNSLSSEEIRTSYKQPKESSNSTVKSRDLLDKEVNLQKNFQELCEEIVAPHVEQEGLVLKLCQLRTALKAATRVIEQQEKQINELQEQNDNLQFIQTEQQNQITQLHQELGNFGVLQSSQLSGSITRLQSGQQTIIKSLREQIAAYSHQSTKLSNENERIKSDNDNLRQQLLIEREAMKDELERVADESAQCRILCQARARHIRQLESKIEAVQDELQSLRNTSNQQFDQQQSEYESILQQLEQARQEGQQYLIEKENAQQQLLYNKSQNEKVLRQVDRLEAELAQAKQDADWNQSMVAELGTADEGVIVQQYAQQMSEFKFQFQEQRRLLEEQIEDWQYRCKQQEAEIQYFKQQLVGTESRQVGGSQPGSPNNVLEFVVRDSRNESVELSGASRGTINQKDISMQTEQQIQLIDMDVQTEKDQHLEPREERSIRESALLDEIESLIQQKTKMENAMESTIQREVNVAVNAMREECGIRVEQELARSNERWLIVKNALERQIRKLESEQDAQFEELTRKHQDKQQDYKHKVESLQQQIDEQNKAKQEVEQVQESQTFKQMEELRLAVMALTKQQSGAASNLNSNSSKFSAFAQTCVEVSCQSSQTLPCMMSDQEVQVNVQPRQATDEDESICLHDSNTPSAESKAQQTSLLQPSTNQLTKNGHNNVSIRTSQQQLNWSVKHVESTKEKGNVLISISLAPNESLVQKVYTEASHDDQQSNPILNDDSNNEENSTIVSQINNASRKDGFQDNARNQHVSNIKAEQDIFRSSQSLKNLISSSKSLRTNWEQIQRSSVQQQETFVQNTQNQKLSNQGSDLQDNYKQGHNPNVNFQEQLFDDDNQSVAKEDTKTFGYEYKDQRDKKSQLYVNTKKKYKDLDNLDALTEFDSSPKLSDKNKQEDFSYLDDFDRRKWCQKQTKIKPEKYQISQSSLFESDTQQSVKQKGRKDQLFSDRNQLTKQDVSNLLDDSDVFKSSPRDGLSLRSSEYRKYASKYTDKISEDDSITLYSDSTTTKQRNKSLFNQLHDKYYGEWDLDFTSSNKQNEEDGFGILDGYEDDNKYLDQKEYGRLEDDVYTQDRTQLEYSNEFGLDELTPYDENQDPFESILGDNSLVCLDRDDDVDLVSYGTSSFADILDKNNNVYDLCLTSDSKSRGYQHFRSSRYGRSRSRCSREPFSNVQI